CGAVSGTIPAPRMVSRPRSPSAGATFAATGGRRRDTPCCTRWCISGRTRVAMPSITVQSSAPKRARSASPHSPAARSTERRSEDQKRTWLPKMARGEVIGCFGLTEPDFGSNPAGMITMAQEQSDGTWLLNGGKMWITNGSTAQIAIVWAKTNGDKSERSIRGFIVATNSKGFKARDQKGKLSLRASDTSELVFEDVHLPNDALLPKSGALKSPLMC